MRTKKESRIAFSAALALILILTSAGWVKAAPAPTQAKPIVLKFADMTPETVVTAGPHKWWAAQIEQRTGGRVKVEFYWTETLVKAYDIMKAIGSGVTQVGPYYAGFDPATAPSFTVANLPGAPTQDEYLALLATRRVAEHPAVVKELTKNNVKFMYPGGNTGDYLQLIKPARRLADLKGLKIRTFGYFGDAVKALGGVPIGMAPPEVYTALERGTIDGNFFDYSMMLGWRTYEVAKYLLLLQVGMNCGMPVVMNLDTWNSLTPETQKIIQGVNAEMAKKMAEAGTALNKTATDKMKASGVQIFDLPSGEREIFREKCKPIWQGWADKLEERGFPGKEVLNLYFSEIERLGKQTK